VSLKAYTCNDCGLQMLNQGTFPRCNICGFDNIKESDYSLESNQKPMSFALQKKRLKLGFNRGQ